VGSDGQIRDVKVLRGIGAGCDEEALRVVNNMPPWKAGKQNGDKVNVQFNMPINFTLK
jgi:protein TonB